MKAKNILLAVFFISLFIVALADEKPLSDSNNRKIDLPYFKAINISTINLDLTLIQSKTNYLYLQEDTQSIHFEVIDSILYLKSSENTNKLKASIHFKELEKIEAKYIVSITSQDKIITPSLILDFDGASKANLSIETKQLHTIVNGSSNIIMNGKADMHKLQIKGAGSINAENLITSKTEVDISGAGKANINVSDEISGKISGAAELYFTGDPELKNLEVTGVAVFRGKGESVGLIGKDTMNLKIGKYKFNIIEEEEVKKKDNKKKTAKLKYNSWKGIELGLLGYLDPAYEQKLPENYSFLELNPATSLSVGLNIHEQNFRIIKDYVRLTTGLGFQINNYKYINNTRLFNNPDSLSGIIDPSVNFSKTKLRISYITLPVLLQFNTSTQAKKAFHFSGGLLLSYHIGSKSKLIYVENGMKSKEKVAGNYHINPFQYSLTARLGYGKNYALYGIYDLNPLFKNDKGPELYSYAVGISLLFN